VKVGDLIRNKNSESGELGIFIGLRTFGVAGRTAPYTCAEVYWPERKKVGTIQRNMVEVYSETR
jgi:hypothetical protein